MNSLKETTREQFLSHHNVNLLKVRQPSQKIEIGEPETIRRNGLVPYGYNDVLKRRLADILEQPCPKMVLI